MADFTGGQKSKSKKMKMELTIPNQAREEQERIAREERSCDTAKRSRDTAGEEKEEDNSGAY